MRCQNPRYVWPKGPVIAVPCGKCLACLANKRQDWSTRLMQEYKVSKSAYFVTLTYSDRFYPREIGVCKRHVQLYLKRLRKKNPRLRYYAVGEYGTKTKRAHYHAILFNVEEKDCRRSWTLLNRKTGEHYDIGIVHIGRVTEASVSYVTKYIVQPDAAIDDLNPPFALMSRGYGIGLNYLSDAMLKWHRDDARLYMIKHGQKIRLPRFYKDKIWPNSDWSDWKYFRETTFKKARLEAERKDELENNYLKQEGYKDPESLRQSTRNAVTNRVKSKVAFSQKF